jgi:hypothetical protein
MTLKKLMAGILLVALAAAAGCTGGGAQTVDKNLPDINPNAESANKDKASVALYFSYNREPLLAAEAATVNVPVSEPLEAAVVRALIAGPSVNRTELSGLFWGNVRLVGVENNADILFVTLSEEFVSTDPEKPVLEEGTAADQKRLAICSIVNTIVEMGTYSRVQIYVDRQAAGAAQRITRQEAGWQYGGNENEHLDLLGRMSELILTPNNTLAEALESLKKKDWTRLYNFTAYTSPDGSVKPDSKAFSEMLADKGNVLESFDVTDANVSSDGQKAVVMLDYVMKTREGDVIDPTNIPVVLLREEDIWKISYTSLVSVLINAG